MSNEVLLIAHSSFITAHLQRFRETGSLLVLATALLLVIRQRRAFELCYGGYCSLFHRPSPVRPSPDEAGLISVIKEKVSLVHRNVLSRAQLIERYGPAFRVERLPKDFRSARCESIWQEADNILVLGEYGERGRLALVTPEGCIINDHYEHIRGVRHIHSVERFGDTGEFLVGTGDTKKLLDVWVCERGRIRFVRRLRRRLAGFTAAIQVNGEYYFGTDFSSRPNYITTLGGEKYFFPRKAFRLYTTAFYAFFDRYLVSVNSELRITGGRRALSIFDTLRRTFIYCDEWQPQEESGKERLGPGPSLELSSAAHS